MPYDVSDALRESEQRYRTLFEQAPVGVFLYDRDLVITDFNPRFVEILRSSPERLRGLAMRSLRDAEAHPHARAPRTRRDRALRGRVRGDDERGADHRVAARDAAARRARDGRRGDGPGRGRDRPGPRQDGAPGERGAARPAPPPQPPRRRRLRPAGHDRGVESVGGAHLRLVRRGGPRQERPRAARPRGGPRGGRRRLPRAPREARRRAEHQPERHQGGARRPLRLVQHRARRRRRPGHRRHVDGRRRDRAPPGRGGPQAERGALPHAHRERARRNRRLPARRPPHRLREPVVRLAARVRRPAGDARDGDRPPRAPRRPPRPRTPPRAPRRVARRAGAARSTACSARTAAWSMPRWCR